MGGHAFTYKSHGFNTSRIDEREYKSISAYILPLLRLYFRVVSIPPEIPGKADYGDIDIMVSQPLNLHPHDSILQLCSRNLGDRCRAFIYNLPTTNIAVRSDTRGLHGMVTAQVDVHIVMKPELWDVDYWMHSWGDMGMIVSSTIKTFGLRLSSSKGLWIEVQFHGPLVLSVDMKTIAQFLGLDWERYCRGFEDVKDIFEWIRQIEIDGAKIGVKRKGKLDKKEHMGRLMWMDYWSLGEDAAYCPSGEEKGRIFAKALDYFGKVDEYNDIVRKIEREKLVREKLNGKRVMEWTGTSGRTLGMLLKTLKDDERLQKDKVVEMDEADIQRIVLEVYNGMPRVGVQDTMALV